MLDLALLTLTWIAQRGTGTPPPKAPRPGAPQRPEGGKGRGTPPAPAAPPAATGRDAGSEERGPPVLGRDEVPQEDGTRGELPPQAAQQRLAVASVDLDTEGRSRADLAGLLALRDGFAVLLSDERDGARGYLLLRLDRELAPGAPPERLDPGASGQGQTDATLAVSPKGDLGAVWFDAADHGGTLRGRWWDAGESAQAKVWTLPLPIARRELETGPSIRTLPRTKEPALAWTPDACCVAWNAGGRVLLRRLHTDGTQERADVLGARMQTAASAPRLAADSSGAVACAFDSGGAVMMFLRLSLDENAHCSAGPGRLCSLIADPSSPTGGWWLLVRRQGQLVLRHLARAGAPDRAELKLVERPWISADLAATPQGTCALVQYADGSLSALWIGGTPAAITGTTKLRTAGDRGPLGARVVASGERFAFAWTERRGGIVDLLACTTESGGGKLLGPRNLLAGDGSAVQEHPRAAWTGERGAIAWTDHRFGEPAVALRGLREDGTLGEHELFLPSSVPAEAPEGAADPTPASRRGREPAKRPAIAVHPSGRGLAAWIGSGRAGPSVFVQAFAVDGEGELSPRASAYELEPEAVQIPTYFEPAVVALANERGFAVAWVRSVARQEEGEEPSSEDGRAEVRIARLGPSGARDGLPRTAGAGSRLARPALTLLDDGRVVLAWDSQPQLGARRLAGRTFSESLEPEVRELCFETMWRGSDYAPSLAPAPGGFAMAWTSGEDPDRDVFARVFDGEGRPLSRPMALSPRAGAQQYPSLARLSDGSFAAVWQDDLSTGIQLVGRRVRLGSGRPGASVRFGFGPEGVPPEGASPHLLQLADGGLLLVASHAVPDRGREIGMCQVGTGWDEVEGR